MGRRSRSRFRKTGEPISGCKITTSAAEFRIEHKPGADLLDVYFGRREAAQNAPIPALRENDLVELVREELMRGVRTGFIFRALAKCAIFLQSRSRKENSLGKSAAGGRMQLEPGIKAFPFRPQSHSW